MENSSVHAQHVDSDSTKNEHRFPWKWWLRDLSGIPQNNKTVFSCFSCGGGSSMGYKLAGYKMVGCCEIDERVLNVYRKNLHPYHWYNMDVRDFLKIPNEELSDELFHLDVLDGSPPCSVFSMAGQREKAWGKEKVFREGQEKQTLDDLFFYFIQIAEKLQPRVVIAENVSGLIKGNARGYVNEIFKAFREAGYEPQLFLLNAAYMGVPQRRERTVFIARRKDLDLPKIKMDFNEKPIYFKEVRREHGDPVNPDSLAYKLLQMRRPGDKHLGNINQRYRGKVSGFNASIIPDNKVCATIAASGEAYRDCDGDLLCDGDIVNVQTFPQDYDFMDQQAKYICGMSVPPVMMAQIATEVYQQWLK